MKIEPTYTKTVVFKEEDIPLWWKKWFTLVRNYGIKEEIPMKKPFEPDWAIINLIFGYKLAEWMHTTYKLCKEIYQD